MKSAREFRELNTTNQDGDLINDAWLRNPPAPKPASLPKTSDSDSEDSQRGGSRSPAPLLSVTFGSDVPARVNLYDEMGWSKTLLTEDGISYRTAGAKVAAHSPVSFLVEEGFTSEDGYFLDLNHRGDTLVRVRFLVAGAYVELGNLEPSDEFTNTRFALPYNIKDGTISYVSFIGQGDIASIKISK